MNTVGHNLKRLRQKEGWVQSDVAKKLNISTPAYSNIEAGVTIINTNRLYEFMDLYKVTPWDILQEEEDGSAAIIANEISSLKDKLLLKDHALIKLQEKAISLHEELRNKQTD